MEVEVGTLGAVLRWTKVACLLGKFETQGSFAKLRNPGRKGARILGDHHRCLSFDEVRLGASNSLRPWYVAALPEPW